MNVNNSSRTESNGDISLKDFIGVCFYVVLLGYMIYLYSLTRQFHETAALLPMWTIYTISALGALGLTLKVRSIGIENLLSFVRRNVLKVVTQREQTVRFIMRYKRTIIYLIVIPAYVVMMYYFGVFTTTFIATFALLKYNNVRWVYSVGGAVLLVIALLILFVEILEFALLLREDWLFRHLS